MCQCVLNEYCALKESRQVMSKTNPTSDTEVESEPPILTEILKLQNRIEELTIEQYRDPIRINDMLRKDN